MTQQGKALTETLYFKVSKKAVSYSIRTEYFHVVNSNNFASWCKNGFSGWIVWQLLTFVRMFLLVPAGVMVMAMEG